MMNKRLHGSKTVTPAVPAKHPAKQAKSVNARKPGNSHDEFKSFDERMAAASKKNKMTAVARAPTVPLVAAATFNP